MRTEEFTERYRPCRQGREFAMQFDTMRDVWEACERPDWLFWILQKHAPLKKIQSVRLAIAFAETCLHHVPESETRPKAAIDAAKKWLAAATYAAADAAAAAADSAYAAEAAYAAADAAAYAAEADYTAADAAKGAYSAAYAAADAAYAANAAAADAAADAAYAAARAAARAAAAYAAARAAADAANCQIIRQAIRNPF